MRSSFAAFPGSPSVSYHLVISKKETLLFQLYGVERTIFYWYILEQELLFQVFNQSKEKKASKGMLHGSI